MILLKFLLVVFGIYFAFYIFIRLFGKAIGRFMLRYLSRKAQEDMEKQSRVYEQHAEGHSPFEDSVYIDKETKVSIRRGQKDKPRKDYTLDPKRIEQVDYEDVE